MADPGKKIDETTIFEPVDCPANDMSDREIDKMLSDMAAEESRRSPVALRVKLPF